MTVDVKPGAMQPFVSVLGPAAPLLRANVDTDTIIRIERLTQIARPELGHYALEPLRYLPDGSEDPTFVLNRSAFRSARTLLAGPNFGCGSSREAAVWALQGLGLRCIVAPSFGDIFFSNCFQNGMLPIQLPMGVVQRLAERCGSGEPLLVDLEASTLTTADGGLTPFSVDGRRRDALLHGLDDIALTLKDDAAIRAWQRSDRATRPWAWPARSPAP